MMFLCYTKQDDQINTVCNLMPTSRDLILEATLVYICSFHFEVEAIFNSQHEAAQAVSVYLLLCRTH